MQFKKGLIDLYTGNMIEDWELPGVLSICSPSLCDVDSKVLHDVLEKKLPANNGL